MFDPSDEQLAEIALKDAGALADLYQRHLSRIYRYILVRVDNIQDAEDLTAQTFTEMVNNLSHYRGDGVFAAWLTVIARNLVTSRYRGQRPNLALDEAETYAEEGSLDDTISQHLQIAQLRAALDTLPDDYAEVIRLRYFAELSTEETAEIMGRSPSAIKMLLRRAMKSLRQRMDVNPSYEVK